MALEEPLEQPRERGAENARADEDAQALVATIYEELRRLAYRQMLCEPRDITLQPTALVHEVFLRLRKESRSIWTDRSQFFPAAAIAMRRILVEAARARVRRTDLLARVPLEQVDPSRASSERSAAHAEQNTDVLALDAALSQLQRVDARLHDVVELRYFAGLSEEQTAALLEVSTRTVRRDWETARLWLYQHIVRANQDLSHDVPRAS